MVEGVKNMTTVQVRTATIPGDSDYFTVNKIYSCEIDQSKGYDGKGGRIVDDTGKTRYIYLPSCAYLNFAPWEIVSDMLREESR
jgi:hypothetical protein